MAVGSSERLEATVLNHEGEVVQRPVSWSTSDAAVAVVDSAGVVTARSLGTTVIRAAVDDQRDSTEVVVAQTVELSAPAWVTNIVSGNVSVLGTDGQVSHTYPIGVRASSGWFEFTRDGSTAYISSYDREAILVVDVASGVVTKEIGVGRNPGSVAISPDGTVVWASVGVGRLSVIDTNSGSVAHSISTPYPNDVAFTPDGSLVYAASLLDTVRAFDPVSREVVAEIPVGRAPRMMGISPDGSTLLVPHLVGDDISVIDVASQSVVSVVAVGDGPRKVAVSPDGAVAYVSNRNSDDVTVIDLESLSVVTAIPVGDDPWFVAFSEDGTVALVTNDDSDNVSVIDVQSHSVIATIEVGEGPRGVAFVPGG